MGYLHVLVFCAIVSLVSFVLCSATLKYAIASGLVDTPNHRSSHTTPTPRGGGLSIVVTSLMGVLALVATDCLADEVGVALVVGGCSIATIGWLDDKYQLSVRLRFSVHLAAALLALASLGGLPSVRFGSVMLPCPVLWTVLAVTGIVWATNLFNFMDGIDGIAGMQTVCMGFGGGLLLMLVREAGLAHCMFILGAAALGFLPLNRHPARIFMGDVGSGFIGFYIATVAVASENASAVPLLLWIMMMAVFVVDATATLLYRTIKGHPWSEAHRTHVYQLAVRSGLSHDQVALTVGAIDCVLIGVAHACLRSPNHAGVIAVVTLITVFAAWVLLRRRLCAQLGRESTL